MNLQVRSGGRGRSSTASYALGSCIIAQHESAGKPSLTECITRPCAPTCSLTHLSMMPSTWTSWWRCSVTRRLQSTVHDLRVDVFWLCVLSGLQGFWVSGLRVCKPGSPGFRIWQTVRGVFKSSLSTPTKTTALKLAILYAKPCPEPDAKPDTLTLLSRLLNPQPLRRPKAPDPADLHQP